MLEWMFTGYGYVLNHIKKRIGGISMEINVEYSYCILVLLYTLVNEEDEKIRNKK